MTKLYFITGNKFKFEEVKNIIPDVEQIDLDLPEIQEMDSRKIIEAKLREAIKDNKGSSADMTLVSPRFFCEDTSLSINSLNGLPGPLIKWFLESVGDKGIFDMVERYEDRLCIAKTLIGYTDGDNIAFFEGEVEGEIVAPRGGKVFGWDKLFLPKGSDKTFGEMSLDEKNEFSMRKKALIKLKDYLDNKSN